MERGSDFLMDSGGMATPSTLGSNCRRLPTIAGPSTVPVDAIGCFAQGDIQSRPLVVARRVVPLPVSVGCGVGQGLRFTDSGLGVLPWQRVVARWIRGG